MNYRDDGERMTTLREKASELPLHPGIYIMKDKSGKVIYVGKSKVLKQRVSQYFAAGANHNLKTVKMVSLVHDFETILCDNNMEALTLENRLIKLYLPKFNIKLKDDKSYPYVRVTMNEPFPRIDVTRKRDDDGAKYFGPYSGISTAYAIMKTARKMFRVASCNKVFPRDIGKSRPCIYSQIGQCCAPCSGKVTSEEYRESYKSVLNFLRGNFRDVKSEMTEKMEFAAENLHFEAAAVYRDRIAALDKLWERQKVVGDPDTDQDVFALYSDEKCSVISVMNVRGGSVIDNTNFVFPAEAIADSETVSSFVIDMYLKREYIPKEILFAMPIDDSDRDGLSDYLRDKAGRKVMVRFPERGELKNLCDMVSDNARQYALQYEAQVERDNETLVRLASMLKLEVVPDRIEAFDISNLGSENTTAGMIVAEEGKLKKSEYRVFKISGEGHPDDYAAMRVAIDRRLNHTETLPDLILLDGGKGHVSTIRALMEERGFDIPVFGMVKDDFHKTRALTSDSEEISIARDQAVFQFVYKLQEEVHRFTVSKMTGAKRKTLKTSSLEKIDGIGPAKAKTLLSEFRSLSAIKEAPREKLAGVRGISEANADAIIEYFSKINT